CAALFGGGFLTTIPARSDDRSPEAILKEIDAVPQPTLDSSKQNDQAYIQRYVREMRDSMAKRAALIGTLFQVDPDNPRLTKLLPERWRALSPMMTGRPDTGDLSAELERVLGNGKNDELKKEAAFVKAQIAFYTSPDDAAKRKAVDEFIKLAPRDDRGA